MKLKNPNKRVLLFTLPILLAQVFFVFGFTFVNNSGKENCCHNPVQQKKSDHTCCVEEKTEITDHCNSDSTSDQITLSDCNCVHKFIPINDYAIQKTFELNKNIFQSETNFESIIELNSTRKSFVDLTINVHSPPIFISHSALLI